MNRSGEGLSINVIVIIVIGVFVLFVVGTAVGGEYRNNVFPFLDNLPWFKQDNSSSSDGPEVIRYDLSDGSLESYTGVDWEIVSGEFNLNGKTLDADRVKNEFENYYYGRGDYEEIYEARGIRVRELKEVFYFDSNQEPVQEYYPKIGSEIIRLENKRIRDAFIKGINEDFSIDGEYKKVELPSDEGYENYVFRLDLEGNFYTKMGLEDYGVNNGDIEMVLKDYVIEWRDEILEVPVKVDVGNRVIYSCAEMNSEYLILRLENEVSENEVC